MTKEYQNIISIDNQPVPIIAFFGTKGGVGKTTILDKFSTLIARAPNHPNVLLVDFDVHHRGLTVLRGKDEIKYCKTIHEYLIDDQLEFQSAINVTPKERLNTQGSEFLIPSSSVSAQNVFQSLFITEASVLVERLYILLNNAAQKYRINVILIDCGPIVDTLTASAAYMSDMSFIIGQNEPITFESLQNYAIRIKDFLPSFDSSTVHVIINKVRGAISYRHGIYAAIPFTMEVVDYSEGLPNIDEVRLIYLDFCVYGIVRSVFEKKYPKLVPEADSVLTIIQKKVTDIISRYRDFKWYKNLQKGKKFLFIAGVVLLMLSAFAGIYSFIAGSSNPNYSDLIIVNSIPYIIISAIIFFGLWSPLYIYLRKIDQLIKLKEISGYDGILELLTSREGRKKFALIQSLSIKSSKENGETKITF